MDDAGSLTDQVKTIAQTRIQQIEQEDGDCYDNGCCQMLLFDKLL